MAVADRALDESKLQAFVGKAVGDWSTLTSAAPIGVGDKLNLYGALHAIADGGWGLGTLATEQALRDVVTAGGLGGFRKATETPFNRVLEARHPC